MPMTFSCTSRFACVTKGKRSMSYSSVWTTSIPWLRENQLLLNGNKTKMITFGTKQRLTLATSIPVTVDSCLISPDATTKNIGIVYDSTLSMEHQVNAVCRGAYLRLHNISRIRRFITQLTQDATIDSDSSICHIEVRLRERVVVWSFYKLTSQATTLAKYGSQGNYIHAP